VVANDLSASAVEAIKRNVKANGVEYDFDSDIEPEEEASYNTITKHIGGRVRVAKGDAWLVLPPPLDVLLR
jgi:tRNA G26 N,N-dimethylase Trm1